jgi:hypothetical protein
MIVKHAVVLVLSVLAPATAACAHDDSTGRLVIKKSVEGPPFFDEGSLTQLRLVREDGTIVVDGVHSTEKPLRLAPGSYTLETVERPCDGNCGTLNGPVGSTRCALGVRVVAGQSSEVSIALKLSGAAAVSRCVTDSPSG